MRGQYQTVIGVDEAGRGPLAGPVVCAAIWIPQACPSIEGITDSKQVTVEQSREELFEKIIATKGIRWCVAVVDAQKIDEINILQATMQGMRMAVNGIISGAHQSKPASIERDGCYIVTGERESSWEDFDPRKSYALVDGNRFPNIREKDIEAVKACDDILCTGEPMVKGDGREYIVAAASVLAKVTRDRLMHGYHTKYPEYNLAQHKGYPTRDHMLAVHKFGASPIHRRTFAPLKHMEFDAEGKVVK